MVKTLRGTIETLVIRKIHIEKGTRYVVGLYLVDNGNVQIHGDLQINVSEEEAKELLGREVTITVGTE